jgi:hypothetical protein
LQDPREVNKDNFSNVSSKNRRHFRNKRREYFKEKLRSFDQTVRISTSETCIAYNCIEEDNLVRHISS